MKTFYLILGVIAVLLLGVVAFRSQSTLLGDSGVPNNFHSATNASSTCVSATSTVILSSGGARQFAYITNSDSTSTTVCMNSVCYSKAGANLLQGDVLKIDLSNLYTGAVSCITPSGTSTVGIIYVQ